MDKRPFIIDCDTGTDDAIAIITALHSPEIDLKAITSVNGNVAEKYTSANNLNLIEYLGFNVPVAHGAVRPLMSRYMSGNHSSATHGPAGFGDVELPVAKESHFVSQAASELIYDTALKEGGALELLVIGPMTNIAIALCNHGDLPGLIKHIWFMGGAASGGNVTPTAEFNIWADPEAAHIVLSSGIPATMVGLDVTLKALMTADDIAALRKVSTRACEVSADLLDFMSRRAAKGGEAIVMHDALALASAIYPECLSCEDYFVDVECSGTYTYGHTYVDRRRLSGNEPNASVALNVDSVKFRSWIVERICSSAKE